MLELPFVTTALKEKYKECLCESGEKDTIELVVFVAAGNDAPSEKGAIVPIFLLSRVALASQWE